jgi:hypothetical protein
MKALSISKTLRPQLKIHCTRVPIIMDKGEIVRILLDPLEKGMEI